MSYQPESLRFVGYDLGDNEISLPAPLEWELVKSFDSPARSFEGIFPTSQAYPELYRLRIFHGDALFFKGELDEQAWSDSGQGQRLTLLARSAGALLLDNEAQPQSYTNVYLNDLYVRHIKPYGILMPNTGINPFFNRYQVLKGLCEWEAFYNFLRSSQIGCAYIDDKDQIRVSETPPEKSLLTLSNRQAGALRYSSLKAVNNRYSPVTRFVIRDAGGAYSSAYDNPKAAAMKLTRKRYLIPSAEFTPFTGGGEMEGMLRVRHSMLGKQVLTVTCPGLLEAAVCDRANVDAGACQWQGLFVHQVRFRLSAAGAVTTLTLLDPQYIT